MHQPPAPTHCRSPLQPAAWPSHNSVSHTAAALAQISSRLPVCPALARRVLLPSALLLLQGAKLLLPFLDMQPLPQQLLMRLDV